MKDLFDREVAYVRPVRDTDHQFDRTIPDECTHVACSEYGEPFAAFEGMELALEALVEEGFSPQQIH